MRDWKGRISIKCCGSVTHLQGTLLTHFERRPRHPLSHHRFCFHVLDLEGHHFHYHFIRLDSADKSCEGLHKQQRFCWQMKFLLSSRFPSIRQRFCNIPKAHSTATLAPDKALLKAISSGSLVASGNGF